MKVLDFIDARLRDPIFAKEYAEGEVDELKGRVALARHDTISPRQFVINRTCG